MTKTPYDDREDIEKLLSQWRKIDGIIDRQKEWSAAIVRAATAAEIAANIAIRKRFEQESEFAPEFVDSLLIWANGIEGKFHRLIIPAERDNAKRKELQVLKKRAARLNKKRNGIVHSGKFASKREMHEIVDLAREIVNALVIPWDSTFRVIERKLNKPKSVLKRKTGSEEK